MNNTIKNILITGASRGIGREMAKRLKGMGHRILVLARNQTALQSLQDECGLDYFSFDLEKLGQPNSQLELVDFIAKWGRLDGLVNNAGYLGKMNFAESDSTLMHRIFEVNYHAPSLLIRLLIPHFNTSSDVHVLNIGSMGGFQGSAKFPGLAHYSASKAALASLTECLAEEYKTTSIRFNCLALGSVQTEMLAEAFPSYKASNTPDEMAVFISEFLLNGHKIFNGKVLPLAGLSV